MSRRLPTLQVRAATTSIGRPTTRYCFHSFSMEEQQTIGGGGGGGEATGAPAANPTANTPTKLTPPLTSTYQSPATGSSSPFSNNSSTPMTPTTPSNSHRLWNPSKGIIFAPSPITPVSPFTTPLSRGFQTKASRKSPLDTPTDTSDSPSDILESPTARSFLRSRKQHSRGPDWAGLMNLTPDGKEKETVPAGFDTFQDDALAESTEGPLGEVKALQEAIGALAEEVEGDTTAPLEEEAEEQYEDPGIERVRTPEGIQIMWKKKPLVYNTDEKDPYVPLVYQVSEEVLQAAVEANENFDMGKYVNAEGVRPTIHYVTDEDGMEDIAKLFENDKAIGFDMEWVANSALKPTASDKDIRTCVSVIQIANQERVAIFHLAKFPTSTKKFLAPTLKNILEDPSVLKTGVWIKADMSRLSTVINVNPAGVLELSDFHSLIFAAEGNILPAGKKLPVSLTLLCKEHLGLPLDKGDVRTSNWSKLLSNEQKTYAANDAYASFRVYDALEQRRCTLDPRPALPPLHTINHEETIEAYHKRKALAKKGDDGTPKKPSAIRVPKDANPQLVKAYDWIKEYAKSKPDGVLATSVANLRCYALWHHQLLDVEDTAAACRDPPLGTAYVAQCILEATLVEKLPYQPGRLLWVMRDLSKEAMGRFYQLKGEAMTKAREHQEQAAAAKLREARERIGWNLDGESSGQADQEPRQSQSRLPRNPKPPDELFASRFERRPKREDGMPNIRYHQVASETPEPVTRSLVRPVVAGKSDQPPAQETSREKKYFDGTTKVLPTRSLVRKMHLEKPGDTTDAPLQRSQSSPPKHNAFRRPLLNNVGKSVSAGTGPAEFSTKILFNASEELEEAVEGFSKASRVRIADDEEDGNATSLRESKSEPNLGSKRPVWIGVPSRRRKNDL